MLLTCVHIVTWTHGVAGIGWGWVECGAGQQPGLGPLQLRWGKSQRSGPGLTLLAGSPADVVMPLISAVGAPSCP